MTRFHQLTKGSSELWQLLGQMARHDSTHAKDRERKAGAVARDPVVTWDCGQERGAGAAGAWWVDQALLCVVVGVSRHDTCSHVDISKTAARPACMPPRELDLVPTLLKQ